MPTYEFRCPDGHEFEKFYRSISGAESQSACPVCGKPAERMMSAAGFAFKGSGFYLTDYGKNAHRGEAPPTAGADAKAEASAASIPSSDSTRSDSATSDSASSAKADTPKSETAKSSESGSSGTESKATSGTKGTESRKADAKAESKPAPAAPKPGAKE